MKRICNKESTWKKSKVPGEKHHNTTSTKTIANLYLNRNLVEKARNDNLNTSRVTEKTRNNILGYLEPQNTKQSSIFLSKASFLKEGLVDGAGFEPAASAMPTLRSFQADLPAHDTLPQTRTLLSIMGKKFPGSVY